jgi:simple sugar transport system substrate-binding protein
VQQQGGAAEPGARRRRQRGGDTSGANLTIQMVTHEQAGDTFWDKIRAVPRTRRRRTGSSLQYSNN